MSCRARIGLMLWLGFARKRGSLKLSLTMKALQR
jgi:hypothetical protein